MSISIVSIVFLEPVVECRLLSTRSFLWRIILGRLCLDLFDLGDDASFRSSLSLLVGSCCIALGSTGLLRLISGSVNFVVVVAGLSSLSNRRFPFPRHPQLSKPRRC